MTSFRAAYERGCNWVECDCRASKDGIIVLAHDDDVFDERDGRSHRVERCTAAELSALDLGAEEGVPTLDELVEWAAGRVGVMADVKRGGLEQLIGTALIPLSPEDKYVAGADDKGRKRFREQFPDLPLSLTVNRGEIVGLRARLHLLDTEAVTFEYPLVNRARVAQIQARGIRFFAWTVDDIAAMRTLAAMGVDGIISNRADLLAEL